MSTEPVAQLVARLTIGEAARRAGCGETAVRKLVRGGVIPVEREATRTGFRYLVGEDQLGAIGSAIGSKRKLAPALAPPGHATGEREALRQELRAEAEAEFLRRQLVEAQATIADLAATVRALTETMTQLALPAPAVAAVEQAGEEAAGRRSWWDWLLGRDAKNGA